jgi:hypothetical protein
MQRMVVATISRMALSLSQRVDSLTVSPTQTIVAARLDKLPLRLTTPNPSAHPNLHRPLTKDDQPPRKICILLLQASLLRHVAYCIAWAMCDVEFEEILEVSGVQIGPSAPYYCVSVDRDPSRYMRLQCAIVMVAFGRA